MSQYVACVSVRNVSCVASVSMKHVSVCGVCQRAVCVSVWHVLVSGEWQVSVCGV